MGKKKEVTDLTNEGGGQRKVAVQFRVAESTFGNTNENTGAWYEGESNENLKFVIKNRNFAPLSCKLVSVPQTACRMTCRWQHSADARTPSQYQYKDGCPT